MKKYLYLICLLSLIFLSFAAFAGPPSPKAIVVQEVDGNPRGFIRILKFPNGSLTIDAGTGIVTYSGGGSETDPVVGAITGIVEADGGGNISAATQGVDYYAPGGTDVADGDVADNITLTNISQITTKPITGLSATNWRLFYSADGAVPVELVLGADGTFLESNGASAAPAFRVLASGDIPDISATYLTLAQIGTPYDTEAEFDALFAAKCDKSTFGDAIEADDFELSGTTFRLVSQIPHTDVAETITAAWAFPVFNLTALTSEPTEVVGRIYRADNDTWDPCGIDGVLDYFVVCTAEDTYVALWDIAGKFLINTIQAAMNIIPDADGIVLTAAQMNSIIVMTGAGDVDIPADMCDTATGQWLTVKSTAAHSNSVDFLDAADDFYLSDGTLVDGAANELVLGGAAGNQATLVCLQANKWWITGEIGTCTSKADD